jgi:hypothetical protein
LATIIVGTVVTRRSSMIRGLVSATYPSSVRCHDGALTCDVLVTIATAYVGKEVTDTVNFEATSAGR